MEDEGGTAGVRVRGSVGGVTVGRLSVGIRWMRNCAAGAVFEPPAEARDVGLPYPSQD